MANRGNALVNSVPSPARSGDGVGAELQSVAALRDAHAPAPFIPQRDRLPLGRVIEAVAGLFPFGLATVNIEMLRRLAPRRLAKLGAGVATGTSAFFFSVFDRSELALAADPFEHPFGDCPYLHPGLFPSHGPEISHEDANCFAPKTKSSPFGPAR